MEAVLRNRVATINIDTPLQCIPAFRAIEPGRSMPEPVPAGDPFAFYRIMAAAIRDGTPVPVDPISARNVVGLIEAAHQGLRSPEQRK